MRFAAHLFPPRKKGCLRSTGFHFYGLEFCIFVCVFIVHALCDLILPVIFNLFVLFLLFLLLLLLLE